MNYSGWGTLSIIFFVFGILFSLEIGRTFCLGDILLETVGLKGQISIGNGTLNIKIYITEFIFILGFIPGRIFRKDLLARAGWMLCLIFGIILGLMLLFITFTMASFTNL